MYLIFWIAVKIAIIKSLDPPGRLNKNYKIADYYGSRYEGNTY